MSDIMLFWHHMEDTEHIMVNSQKAKSH